MISWKDAIEPAAYLANRVASAYGGPTVAVLVEEATELTKFAFQSAEDGLTVEAIIQQLQDRHFDLLNRLKG